MANITKVLVGGTGFGAEVGPFATKDEAREAMDALPKVIRPMVVAADPNAESWKVITATSLESDDTRRAKALRRVLGE